jgi:hypothetical protein
VLFSAPKGRKQTIRGQRSYERNELEKAGQVSHRAQRKARFKAGF